MTNPTFLSIITPSQFNSTPIHLPGSKSESNRALILRAVSRNIVNIKGLSNSDDTESLQNGLETHDSEINCGHAGSTFRFLTSYFSGIPNKEIILTGSENLKKRPIAPLIDTLRLLGAEITYIEKEGYPPIKIKGKELISSGPIDIDSSISSQFISALLLISTTIKNGLSLNLINNSVSTSYILLTKKILKACGVNCIEDKNNIQIIDQKILPTTLIIEADWSAASYWYGIKALGFPGNIKLLGLKEESFQGDQAIQILMKKFGIETVFFEDGIELRSINFIVEKQEINCLEFPDLAQTLIVLSAVLKLPYSFSGLQTLKIKETNRIKALQKELKKIGCSLAEKELVYSLTINKEFTFDEEINFDTYEDHRMALSFAMLAMKWEKINIQNPMVITKSYPTFWKDLAKVGFELNFN